MERRLHAAAVSGSADTLLELLRDDPLILDKVIVSCVSQTPLHTSAGLGHSDFSRILLTRSPQLATELDSLSSSPLHLASAEGHLEIVKHLLTVDHTVCYIRNRDGRTPMHMAVVEGRVEVLAELIRVEPGSARVLTDRGETVLHLSVMYDRLEAMKLLVGYMGKDGIVNWKDHDGNTVLHLVVARKQIEMIEHLLTNTGVEVNALNSNGFTALDIIYQTPRDLKDISVRESLKKMGALRATDIPMFTRDLVSAEITRFDSKKKSSKPKQIDWFARKKSTLMVIASLIATVAFQAGISPPGGVWPDDLTVDENGKNVSKPHRVGMSIMAYEKPEFYGQFMIFNTTAFLASLSIILLLVSGLPLKKRRWMWLLMGIMWVAISTLALTYFIALVNLTPEFVRQVLYQVNKISFLGWLALIVFIFIVHLVRLHIWLLGKLKEFISKD